MKYSTIILIFIFLSSFSYSQVPPKDFIQAETNFKNKNYSKALDLYNRTKKKNSSFDKYYILFKIGECHYYLGDNKKSKKALKKALKIKSDHKHYKHIKGSTNWIFARMYSKAAEYEKSISYYEEAIKYYDNPSWLLSSVAIVETRAEKYDDALEHVNQAIILDERNAYAYSNRALILLRLSRLGEARIDADKAMELAPKNPYAFKHSAMIYIAQKEYNKACKDLHKSEELGYQFFDNESDKHEVKELINEFCKKVMNQTPR